MTTVLVHPLSPTEIVYIVFHDGKLVHIGESESIVRAFNYVRDIEKTLGAGVTANFFEVTNELRSLVALPASAPTGCLFRGNLERLLQAAFAVRYGSMPERDTLRGGKGVQSAATGGYVGSVDVLKKVFELLDELNPPKQQAVPWPQLPTHIAVESIDPVVSMRRPGTRRRCLAFWVEFPADGAVSYLGHVPDNNKTPQYGATTREIIWSQKVGSPASI